MHTVAYGVPSCVRGNVAAAHTLINPYPLLLFLFFQRPRSIVHIPSHRRSPSTSASVAMATGCCCCCCCRRRGCLTMERGGKRGRGWKKARVLFCCCRCILMCFDANWRVVTSAAQEHCGSRTSILSRARTITSVFPAHWSTSYSPVPEGKGRPEVASDWCAAPYVKRTTATQTDRFRVLV